MKKLIALAVVAACSSPVFAQSVGKFYGEAAYSTVTAKDVSTDNVGTFKPTAARLTLGTVVTENLAVEGFLLQGMSSDSNNKAVTGGIIDIDVKIKSSYGLALRPFVNVTNDVELFGRVGTMQVKNEVNVTAQGRSIDSFSSKTTHSFYGLGVAYKINDNLKATVDYSKLSTKNELESSIFAIGLRYNF